MKLLKWLFGSSKPALNKPVVSGQVLKNPRLRYRKNGDVDYDPDSREPSFVQYNNAREIIRQSKLRGERFAKIQLSNASEEALRYDGYKIEYRNAKDGDGEYDTVRW